MHTIVVGSGMEIHGLRPGVLETERVDSITICDDARHAQNIIKRAKANRPRKETCFERIRARRRITKWVDEVVRGFPADKRPSIRRVADRYYNPTARRAALDVFNLLGKLLRETRRSYRSRIYPPTVTWIAITNA